MKHDFFRTKELVTANKSSGASRVVGKGCGGLHLVLGSTWRDLCYFNFNSDLDVDV